MHLKNIRAGVVFLPCTKALKPPSDIQGKGIRSLTGTTSSKTDTGLNFSLFHVYQAPVKLSLLEVISHFCFAINMNCFCYSSKASFCSAVPAPGEMPHGDSSQNSGCQQAPEGRAWRVPHRLLHQPTVKWQQGGSETGNNPQRFLGGV